jgi:hypothetical protein
MLAGAVPAPCGPLGERSLALVGSKGVLPPTAARHAWGRWDWVRRACAAASVRLPTPSLVRMLLT